VAAAAVLSDGLRDGDVLYRVGGDEFAAVLEVAEPDDALDVARRLCRAVRDAGTATTSIGVAVAEPGEANATLLARADRALYAVKASGRNGVALLPV
jgi:diguanylate cyclase (GGDEF)-like protein